jgi:hypothetical protein
MKSSSASAVEMAGAESDSDPAPTRDSPPKAKFAVIMGSPEDLMNQEMPIATGLDNPLPGKEIIQQRRAINRSPP